MSKKLFQVVTACGVVYLHTRKSQGRCVRLLMFERRKRYGHIGYLQSLLIDDQLMKAAIQKMDSLTIVTFGSLDLTPTMEEDSVLLNIPSLLPSKLHWHEPRAGSGFKKKLDR